MDATGQQRKDVFALLKTYLGCDYDASLHLTIPIRLLPRPRLGDPITNDVILLSRRKLWLE